MDILLELNLRQKLGTRLGILLFGIFTFTLLADNTMACLIWGIFVLLMMCNITLVFAITMTLGRDLIALKRFCLFNKYLLLMEYRKWPVARIFQDLVRRHPQKPCIIMDAQILSFQDVEEYTNRVGAYFKRCGLKHGDCVALLLETRPEYVCLWLGLSKIGVSTALINSNLRRDTLLHSIVLAKASAIIVGTELCNALAEIQKDGHIKDLPIYQFSDEQQRTMSDFALMPSANDLTIALKSHAGIDLSTEVAWCTSRDKLLYVYTSGTTGMPKAAVITNMRYLFMAAGAYYMFAIKGTDVIYNPLPLYHTAGGILGVGNALLNGSTMVLRKKFSASNFWKDCIKYDCTVAQYIGELCRYLLATPNKTEDRAHKLRLMYGNGLRPQIWTQFVTRFNILHIGEVYGSTEGNSNLANIDGRVGAIGFVPILGRYMFPVQLIKCNDQTGEPLRNKKGYCTRCTAGETGLLIGAVSARHAATAFHGYADKADSEKKLLHDVFCKGDVYFNSGDMIVSDLLGYYYFKDRTGDTFRWRGENVATQEVEAIITSIVGLRDCVVYGVNIPHVEGKAGMAAIVDAEQKLDMEYLSIGIRGSLPAYARPLFVRLMKDIPRTATFKLKKRELMVESYDITKIKDPIYYLNTDGIYRPLIAEQYVALQRGQAGL